MKMKQSYILILAVLISLTVVFILVPAQEQPPALPEQSGDQTPPPLPTQSQKQYYFEENNKKVGPLSLEQIQERIKNGSLKRHTLVWKTGKIDWSRAEYLLELKDMFVNEAPAPDLPANMKYKKYMVGVWEIHDGNENQRSIEITSTATTTYKKDGTFSYVKMSRYPSLEHPITSEPITGKWYVEEISNDRFTLTVKKRQSGLNPVQSFTLRIIDENTLLVENSGREAKRIAN